MGDWPNAYRGVGGADLARDYPEKMIVHVMGGLHGSGPAFVDGVDALANSGRDLALKGEKISERCRFINSVRDDISV